MQGNTFWLKIIACNRIFFDGECESLMFEGCDGKRAILAHHEPMTCAVEIGEIRFRLPGGEVQRAVVSDGILTVGHNRAELFVYSAEKPEEIDVRRANAALERAKEYLSHQQSLRDYHMSVASMSRAMARLKGAGEKDSMQ